MKKHTGWRVIPLNGKYYGTEVGIGDRGIVNVWLPLGSNYTASVREVARGWDLSDGFDHTETQESYETACLIAAAPELLQELKRLRELVSLLTVRQIINAGDKYIEWAGINQWCMSEGLADGDELYSDWRADAVIAKAEGQ